MSKHLIEKPFSPLAAALHDAPEAEIAALRGRIAGAPLRAFDSLDMSPIVPGPSSQKRLDSLVDEGWQRAGTSIPSLRPPLPWDTHGRTFSFHLHGWEPVSALLAGFEIFGDRRYFDLSREIALSWLETFQTPLAPHGLLKGVGKALDTKDTMAWYDMAVGQRIYRLAYILDVLAREDATVLSDVRFVEMLRSLIFHLELLAVPAFFFSHNNHGFFQAIGQMAAARRFRYLPGFEDYYVLGAQRLRLMLSRSFFPSGPHMEHSPFYHRMVLGSCLGAIRSGLIEEEDLAQTIRNAEHALSWMVQPDGSLANFGDSDLRAEYVPPRNVAHHGDEAVKVMLTGGAFAAPAPQGLKYYPEAGYVFARKLAGLGEKGIRTASYFAQMAAFHSRVHKHADHGTFVWSEQGQRILIDPGKYGYEGKTKLGSDLSAAGFFYSDPNRIYVEKTRSHNCVEIDNTDYARRRAKHFANAFTHASEQNGLWVTFSEYRHGRMRHLRLVVVRPGHFLLTMDWLKDSGLIAHDFRQWFQLAPEWQPSRTANGLRASHARAAGLSLCAGDLLSGAPPAAINVGQTSPEMSGWSSDGPLSMVPSPAINWLASQTPAARFATLFTVGSRLQFKAANSRLNDSVTIGTFQWQDDAGRHTLDFTRNREDGTVVVKLS
jgi:hypothetical protein